MSYPTSVLTYVALGTLSAVIVHRVLKRTGRVFLDELFRNHPAAGSALTRLLDLCYLLFNLGYVALAASTISTWVGKEGSFSMEGAREVAGALGLQLLLLSVAHGVNIWLFSSKVARAMRANEREIEELLRS